MIKTSVIFCGGYGTRLGSITKKKPKPMVLVNKKPFLEHLLIQLKNVLSKSLFDFLIFLWKYFHICLEDGFSISTMFFNISYVLDYLQIFVTFTYWHDFQWF